MNKRIFIIGIGMARAMGGRRRLERKAKEKLCSSEAVLVSTRVGEIFSGYEEFPLVKKKIRSINDAADTISALKKIKGPVSVLASGDPLFFGIASKILEAFGAGGVEVYPELSSMQLACSKALVPWHDAFFVSFHGSTKREWAPADIPLLYDLHEKMIVLTGGANSPRKIAALLPADARVLVFERLGYGDERFFDSTARKVAGRNFREPNLLMVLRPGGLDPTGLDRAGSAFGLTEEDFEHERGLITKDEIRAAVLHKLRLPGRGVFWDTGAGSGAVSIEAKRLSPALKVYAVEKDPRRAKIITRNAWKLSAGEITVVRGEAPEALEGLPAPSRVFIGGSGGKLADVIKSAARAMKHGIIVATLVRLDAPVAATELLRTKGFKTELASISVSRAEPLGKDRFLKALNPVFILKAER